MINYNHSSNSVSLRDPHLILTMQQNSAISLPASLHRKSAGIKNYKGMSKKQQMLVDKDLLGFYKEVI
jgi:hypothetical protein